MKSEVKVALLFLATVGLVLTFAIMLGAFNPFESGKSLTVAYNYAGGLETGSPVRVMGIKVGRVKSIDFANQQKMENGEEVKLKVEISVEERVWGSIREDSKFYINMAGVIGEKFLEISPGSLEVPQIQPNSIVRGEDPPRVDQLISQSYGLAGKIIDLVEKNEGSVVETLETMNKLVVNLESLLKQVNKTAKNHDMQKLVKNLILISDDVSFMTSQLRSKKGQNTIGLVNELIHRLEALDSKAIRKFLQEEGIRAKLF